MLPPVVCWVRYEWSAWVKYLRWFRAWLSWWTYEQDIRKFCFTCDKTVLWFHRAHCGFICWTRTHLTQAERDQLTQIVSDYRQRRSKSSE